jgi:hypothetical protein
VKDRVPDPNAGPARCSAQPLDGMRSPLLIAAILTGTPAASYACSCMGTQSIGNALVTADAAVVGKVTGHKEAEYSDVRRPALINVEVIDSVTGGVKGNIEIAKSLMCYASFRDDDIEVGKSYLFPLEEIDLANPDHTWGLMIGSDSPVPSYKMFTLPVCSHNALLLDGQGLYTSELTSDGGRRLEYYMPLLLVRTLLPIRLLGTWGCSSRLCSVCISHGRSHDCSKASTRGEACRLTNRWRDV